MKPVRTADSNLVYAGPTRDIGDLHCRRIERGDIESVWYLTPAERARIADGANVGVRILGEPIQPLMVYVTEQPGIGEDAPEVLERLATLVDEGVFQ